MKEIARPGGGRALLIEALRILGATIGQTLVHNGTEFVPATPAPSAPAAHAASHATGGSDPITADSIGALAVTELNKPVHGLNMDGEVISGLAEPAADDHATTKLYVDTAVAGARIPAPLLLTSLNATVTDATPGTDGSAAIDPSGTITLSTENALAFSFNNGPKVSRAFTLDAGSRFRARVRLVSKAGPSSDTIVGLYYGGGFAVFARLSGQIGVWDLGAGVPATSSLTALWDGSEYLEIRVSDGLVQYGIWQGTVFTPFYAALRNDQASSVGVVMSSAPAGATQTVVLDGFTITDLRVW